MNVFSFFSSKKIFNAIYRAVAIIVCIFWMILTICLANSCVAKYYLYPLKNKQTVCEFADIYGLERSLIFAMIKVESGFDEDAESRVGAVGYMQITPDTAKYIADMLGVVKYDMKDGRTNINFGCFYVKYLISKFKNIDTAIVAYNAGEGNVIIWLNDSEYSIDGKSLNNIPYEESRQYLEKVKNTQEKYKKLYGDKL